MALIATPKSPTANSYATRAEADTYLTSFRLDHLEWDDADGETQDAALIWATTMLDVSFDWFGVITDTTQRLRCPRNGWFDKDGRALDPNTIPEVLRNATAEMALSLLKVNHVDPLALLNIGLSEFRLGPLAGKVDASKAIGFIPSNVLAMLEQYGEVLSVGLSGSKVIPLIRV